MADAIEPTAAKLPRWRGFNLLEMFHADKASAFQEADFDFIAEHGFDFARLPLNYRCWAKPDSPRRIGALTFRKIDQAIELGLQRRIHVSLNLHRLPGYCVNPPAEPKDLWTSDEALEDAAYHWSYIARRYQGISNAGLSFDLINEPPKIDPAVYRKVVRRLVEAIREQDAGRLIIADGLQWGRAAVPELADLGIAQSTRGYTPMHVSHYKADWVKGTAWSTPPTWPLPSEQEGQSVLWSHPRLSREYDDWRNLKRLRVGVHVGEFGAFNQTPHAVALAWMIDLLSIWKTEGWGWALWNLHGAFGVLDSQRSDVEYEQLGDHKLDRRMLELLQAY